ncbi:MAG: SDR family oxidoreductase [Desulfarculus sp.]|nr:MAG: SDR family oxidoreductase [Desulfarculus sp.]
MRFQGKRAIVTGGNRGLGRSFASRLAGEGGRVMIAGRDQADLAATAADIQAAGGECRYQPTDVTQPEQVAALVQATVEAWGGVDILINNAGGSMDVPKTAIEEITPDDWDKVVALNLRAVYLCCRAVAPLMKAQRSGKIVNLSSMAARLGGTITPLQYSSSKAAIITFTRHLAQELGPYGINVNAVAPSVILSGPRVRKMWDERLSEQEKDAFLKRSSLRRLGTVEEITGPVLFLCSQEAGFITGVTLDVNGGMFSV